MKKEKLFAFGVPIAVSALALVAALTDFAASADWRLYDMLLNIRQEPMEHPSILLTDFDDASIAEIGTWPIGRDVVADGLVPMGELGASFAVFDIEYVNASPRGVDVRYLDDDLPGSFNEGFGALEGNARGLFQAIASGRIPLREAESYIEDLAGLTQSVRDELLVRVRKVAADNDDRLGKAARFFGSSYFTLNMRQEETVEADSAAAKIATEKVGREFSEKGKGYIPTARGIIPTIPSILTRGAGAGFPNVFVDEDGVRRRIAFFYEYEGQLFGQLVIAPLLDLLKSTEISISRNSFVLKDAVLPSGYKTDIRIPRAEDGRVLIDWPHKSFEDSFRHIPFRELLAHEKLFSDLAHNLRIRDDWGYFSGYDGAGSLPALAAKAEAFRRACLEDEELPENARAALRELRDQVLAETQRFLNSEPEQEILAQVDAALASGRLDQETVRQYGLIKADAPEYFRNTRNLVADLTRIRTHLAKELAGSFCIIGWTSTGTTDIGVNPFNGEYVNVGTHAAVLNTVLQRSFLDDAPLWWSFIIAVAVSFGLTLIIAERKPQEEIVIGLVCTVLIGAALAAVFAFTGRFIAPALPIFTAFATFLATTIISFLRTEREKGFLRNAFSHYLSADVIKEIVADPGMLKLGGTKKRMTAMFTDIRGFSTVSEKLTPEDLVRLLNRYLTGMSDVILDLKGTIDKYEGDAIIAFFGAPIDLPDHAVRACTAALKMKKIESELNRQFLDDKIAPAPLLTRLGINTGDMVVGNMGTDRKMDYTIIGDSVNLAARLEGVNKQYGTWICVSEATMNAAGNGFVYRKLDKIRVVGKLEPIQIFELVDELSSISREAADFFDEFAQAMHSFESREWQKALERFTALSVKRPNDGPSRLYIGRCEAYLQDPPPEDWDGVFNLTSK